MFETLSAYLDGRASPEQKALLLNACRILVEAGYDEHVSTLYQNVVTADLADTDIYQTTVEVYMVPLYRRKLAEFGVITSDYAQLEILGSIMEALNRIDNWDDAETLNDMCANDEGPNEALSDLLGLVGEHSSEEYLAALESVSPDLMTRITEVTDAAIEGQIQTDPQEVQSARERVVARLRKFLRHIPAQHHSLLDRYLDGRGRVNESVRAMVYPFYDALAAMDNLSHVALEILALLAGSDLPDAELQTGTMGLTEQLVGEDEFKLVTISREVEAIIKKALTDESV